MEWEKIKGDYRWVTTVSVLIEVAEGGRWGLSVSSFLMIGVLGLSWGGGGVGLMRTDRWRSMARPRSVTKPLFSSFCSPFISFPFFYTSFTTRHQLINDGRSTTAGVPALIDQSRGRGEKKRRGRGRLGRRTSDDDFIRTSFSPSTRQIGRHQSNRTFFPLSLSLSISYLEQRKNRLIYCDTRKWIKKSHNWRSGLVRNEIHYVLVII